MTSSRHVRRGAASSALLLLCVLGFAIPGCPLRGMDAGDPGGFPPAPATGTEPGPAPRYDAEGRVIKVVRTDAAWRQRLTPEQYRVTRERGTEPPYRNAFFDHDEEGTYLCVGCALPLFTSASKFASCAGWPSFRAPADPRHVTEVADRGFGMERTEAVCARCDAHLGHVFEDGPPPDGRRW